MVVQTVKVNGNFLQAIIDTGAGLCIVTPDVVRRLKCEERPWGGPAVALADGRVIVPTAGVWLSIEIKHRIINVFAGVMELGCVDLLLGNDALVQLGTITVDYTAGPPQLRLEDNEGFDSRISDTKERRKIRNHDGVTIPAFSAKYVALDLGSLTEFEEPMLFEPNGELLRRG